MKNVDKKDFIMIGCDLHENSMMLAVAHGTEKPRFIALNNDGKDRAKLVEMLRQESQKTKADVFLVYESCGLGYGLYDEITEAGFQCAMLAPSKIAKSTKSRKNKTDKRDAELLLSILRGHLYGGNELPDCYVPDEETRDDRLVVRMRVEVGQKLAECKRQATSLLKQAGMKKPDNVGKSWTKSHRAWLENLTQTGPGFGFQQALSSLLRQVQWHEEEVERLDEAVEALTETQRYAEPVRDLCEIKGVGILTAMVFLTEVGDMGRFSNRRQIAAYLGLVPTADESGEVADRKGHITRQGPWRVRKVLNQAARNAARYDPLMHARYVAIVNKNPKKKKIGIVAIMRHLAILMWHRASEVQRAATETHEPAAAAV